VLPNAEVTASGTTVATVYTDGSGAYNITVLNDTEYTLTAGKNGYDDDSTSINTTGNVGNIDFDLSPSATQGTVTGYVLNSTGGPIPGATVKAYLLNSLNGTSAPSANDGSYTLDIPGNTYDMRASHNEYVWGYRDNIAITNGATTPGINFTLFKNFHDIEVVDVTVSDNNPDENTKITATVTVRNNGGASDTFTLRLRLNGNTVYSQSKTLAGQVTAAYAITFDVGSDGGKTVLAQAELTTDARPDNNDDSVAITVRSTSSNNGNTGGRSSSSGSSGGGLTEAEIVKASCSETTKTLSRLDKIEADHKGTTYTIRINDLHMNSVDVKVYPVPSRSFSIEKEEKLKIDLDKDGSPDFIISFKDLDAYKGKFTYSLLCLDEPDEIEDDEEEPEPTVIESIKEGMVNVLGEITPKKSASIPVGIILVLLIIAIGLAIFFGITRKDDVKRQYNRIADRMRQEYRRIKTR